MIWLLPSTQLATKVPFAFVYFNFKKEFDLWIFVSDLLIYLCILIENYIDNDRAQYRSGEHQKLNRCIPLGYSFEWSVSDNGTDKKITLTSWKQCTTMFHANTGGFSLFV